MLRGLGNLAGLGLYVARSRNSLKPSKLTVLSLFAYSYIQVSPYMYIRTYMYASILELTVALVYRYIMCMHVYICNSNGLYIDLQRPWHLARSAARYRGEPYRIPILETKLMSFSL